MNMRKSILPAYICLSMAVLSACHRSESAYTPQAVSNIYGLMRDYNSLDSASATHEVEAMQPEITAFFKTVSEMPLDSEIIRGWASSQAVEMFTPPVDSVFGGVEQLENILGHILNSAEANGIDLPQRRYAAVVYDRPKSILFVDSVMLIALNHYLGADFPGYSHWPYFMRQSKTPQALPFDIAEALVATSYPFRNDNPDALSRLLYEGALTKAKMALNGSTDAAAALGYDEDTYKRLLADEENLWRSLIASQTLYDTSSATIDKLVYPAPQVTLPGITVPGRAGRFIGYRIVESYLAKHPSTSLAQLLSPTFYANPSALIDAEYQP